ncbi:hypothetical protein BDZ91DRAFT_714940 [Kalaharituber pfeilii]|nr:hypothetical protein BDZ91DRAFT_714940 [Kalaharituber pfeilii]
MQPTTTPISIEEEPSNPSYLPQRSGTDVDSTQYQLHHPPQRQDSFRHHQPQQGIQSQSQQQPQQQLQPQQQYYQDQRRRSMENTNNPLQHAPLTRELSGQLQAMQPYANQQPGSPLPPPTQDNSSRRMTPPLNPGGPQQQQQPQPQPQQQNQPSGQQQQGPHNNHGGVRTMDIQKLCEDYDSLQAKYRKVKNLYFERGNEIERLQNTLAHQRLAQSRTSLDDSEYASRFERLDGAIKNVAFEIRQCWKTIPPWLQPVTSHGAEIKGGREMTVVGRASISRWVVDEILEMFFHPGLDPSLSVHLKTIEQNIRRNHHDPQSIEEDDALSSKVCNWRLTTLDALRHELQGPLAAENKARLTQHLVEKLVASLQMHLREPSPPGLLGGVSMIVDIAIGLASNLPLESRDVRVWYPAPGVLFDGKFMKVEGQLPPLTPSISEGQQQQGGQGGEGGQGGDRSLMELDPQSNNNEENGSKDQSLKHSGSVNGPGQSSTSVQSSSSTRSEKISGPMTRMVKRVQEATGTGKSGHGQQLGQQQGPNQAGKGGSQINLGQQPSQGQEGQQSGPQGGNEESKTVRIAGFMAVEVRGRSILVKAPVWC